MVEINRAEYLPGTLRDLPELINNHNCTRTFRTRWIEHLPLGNVVINRNTLRDLRTNNLNIIIQLPYKLN